MKLSICLGVLGLTISQAGICEAFQSAPSLFSRNTDHRRESQLHAAKRDNKGVYARPSAAIERGSGFFIPGLEGPRVRLVFGLVVLVLTGVNHDSATSSLEEGIALGYGILLLLQAAIEFGKEEKGFVVTLDRPLGEAVESSSNSLVQRWAASSSSFSAGWKERVQWSAASYIALTPATSVVLIENDEILYALGNDVSPKDEVSGCKAALETLAKAKSGRVSLPVEHPTVVNLAPEDSRGRCIVLQTIDDNKCWMMTSNQLVQAFTSQDLKWLGQLASYVQ